MVSEDISNLKQERERERVGKKMIELMKLREKRKTKEKESKETGKMRWSSFGTSISCVFFWWLCKFMLEEFSKNQEWAWLEKLIKFCYYTFIIVGILAIIISIYLIFFGYPKICEEVKQLKAKEKQLEQEIAKQ
ncbi:hypothetical protein [endosymbiont GvMRE of Glomus versiforme]|uniref:hypothetical protein n=1 Tax=endosymbiont GvMRE of Glomus versiforme TaxID=2039283 RepID=UPI000EDB7E51|nr:hypothetical protein [endosymbiont GvMRE of Glomus versiforme]RHZ36538.1 hypothetical protein GvMRE_I2g532 [endosymbiont GvMRE of Glomus versiforme]